MATHATIGNDLGFFVRWFDVLDTMGDGGASATIDGNDQLLAEAEALLDSDATHKALLSDIIGRLNLQYDQIQAMKASVIVALNNWAHHFLAAEIDSTATELPSIMGDLAYQMRADSVYVKSSGVTVGSATAGARNTCAYAVCMTADSPWSDQNENIQTEDLTIVCRGDAQTDGQTQYKELFAIQGNITGITNDVYAVMIPGTDDDYANRIQNAATAGTDDDEIAFENFTVSNTPNDWTLTIGTAGTQIKESSAQYLFGAKCLNLVGDGTQLTELRQDANTFYGATATDQKLKPGEKYILGMWIKTDGAIAAGVLDLRMVGTAYTPESSEYVAIDLSSSPPSDWTFYKAYVRMPKAIPTDIYIRLKITTAVTNTENIYIDGLVFARMRYLANKGVYAAVVAGGTTGTAAAAIAGPDPDYWKLPLTNSAAGLFQEFMTLKTDPRAAVRVRKRADIQIYLPHAATASSEYAESKAQ